MPTQNTQGVGENQYFQLSYTLTVAFGFSSKIYQKKSKKFSKTATTPDSSGFA